MSTTLTHLSAFPGFTALGNEALAAALDALPGYEATVTARAALETATAAADTALSDARVDRDRLVERVAESMRDGSTPAGVPRDALKATTALAQAQATRDLLSEVSNRLSTERDQRLTTAPDTLLRHLHGQLRDVVTEARDLDLAGATDADEAIAAGVVAAWQGFLALRSHYFVIRDAQRTVVGRFVTDHTITAHLDTFGALRNYADLFPRWLDAVRRVPERIVNGDAITYAPSWPTDPAAFFLHAVTHPDLDLWVPTARDLQDAYKGAHAAALRADAARQDDEPQTDEQARNERRRRELERQYL